MLGRPLCACHMHSNGFHTLSDNTWSVVYDAVPAIRLAGSVSTECFSQYTCNLLFTQGQMGVPDTLRISLAIFICTVCIQNVRLFGAYDVRWPSTLTRWSVSCLLVYRRARPLRDVPAPAAIIHLAGVAPCVSAKVIVGVNCQQTRL